MPTGLQSQMPGCELARLIAIVTSERVAPSGQARHRKDRAMSQDCADSSRAGLITVLIEAAAREEAIITQLVDAVQKDDRKAILKAARLLAQNRNRVTEDES